MGFNPLIDTGLVLLLQTVPVNVNNTSCSLQKVSVFSDVLQIWRSCPEIISGFVNNRLHCSASCPLSVSGLCLQAFPACWWSCGFYHRATPDRQIGPSSCLRQETDSGNSTDNVDQEMLPSNLVGRLTWLY